MLYTLRILFLFMLLNFPALAWQPFVATNVPVDVNGTSAAQARDTALQQGQAKALRQVFETMVPKEYWSRLPRYAGAQLNDLVADMGVEGEKLSPTRYIASLNIRFKPERIRSILKAADIPYTETPSKQVVILPVFQDGGAILLWDNPNPWMEAFKPLTLPLGPVPMVLPSGDLNDIGLISAEQALQGDKERLFAIAKKYNAGDTLVVEALNNIDPGSNSRIIDIRVTRPQGLAEQTIVHSISAQAKETDEAVIKRAAQEIVNLISEGWKQANLVRQGQSAVISVIAPIKSLAKWAKLKQKLEKVSLVSRQEIISLNKKEARINIYYSGEPSQLAIALLQADVVLEGNENAFTLRLKDD